MAELENIRQGPTVLKERVRGVGGDLAIESTPGRGARLEILLPHDSYGQSS
jgi:signal transduction histidine kinase